MKKINPNWMKDNNNSIWLACKQKWIIEMISNKAKPQNIAQRIFWLVEQLTWKWKYIISLLRAAIMKSVTTKYNQNQVEFIFSRIEFWVANW